MILAFVLLSILLLMFLLVPVWYRKSDAVIDQSEENLRLYQERTAEVASSDMDSEQKAALQLELDREFLASSKAEEANAHSIAIAKRWPLAVALLACVLVGTIILYSLWGSGVELRATQLLQKSSVAQLSNAEMLELRDVVQESSRRNPENLEWAYIEGRMAMSAGEFKNAEAIFSDILVSLPEDEVEDRAGTLSLLAQTKFFGNGQKADAQSYALLKESLALMPNQLQNLGLGGMMAFELGEYRDAVEHWKALWLALPDTPESGLLLEGINRAAEYLREQGEVVDLSFAKRAGLKVLVEVSAAARVAFSADTPVFVAARAVNGPPMPLAAQRLTLGDLPQVVTLSDAQAMMPGVSLSQYDPVTVVARISPSGQPTAQAGDWQGELKSISNKSDSVLTLIINTQVK